MSKKTNVQRLRKRLKVKKEGKFPIEVYSEKRIEEFLREDKIGIKTLKRAQKLLS